MKLDDEVQGRRRKWPPEAPKLVSPRRRSSPTRTSPTRNDRVPRVYEICTVGSRAWPATSHARRSGHASSLFLLVACLRWTARGVQPQHVIRHDRKFRGVFLPRRDASPASGNGVARIFFFWGDGWDLYDLGVSICVRVGCEKNS